MIFYHGSKDRKIKKFKLSHSRRELDFGKGIYLTTSKEQAEEWARRNKKGAVYKFDLDTKKLKCVEYKDEDLNYVFYLCRIDLEDIARDEIDGFKDADIIIGKVLDGNVLNFKSIAEKFNVGDISYKEFADSIKLHDDKNQWCFKTKKAVELLNQSLVEKYFV